MNRAPDVPVCNYEVVKTERQSDVAPDRYRKALTTIVLQSCNGHTQPDSTLRTSLSHINRTAKDALADG